MPHFIVYALDKPDREAKRIEIRDAHRARLRNPDHPVTVAIGGPLHDDNGKMIGSMLVVEAETKAVVESFVAGDPYTTNDVYGSITVHPYSWGIGNPNG